MKYFNLFIFLFLFEVSAFSQEHSVAHEWSENLLEAIRSDFARPTVHARNLYHSSLAMYEIWSIYDTTGVSSQMLAGKSLDGVFCPLLDFPREGDLEAQREVAISYAMYRIMRHRFAFSPGRLYIYQFINDWMMAHDLDIQVVSTDYLSGDPAALGNHIAQCIIEYGSADSSNEENDYENLFYEPQNPALVMAFEGNETIADLNHWQPLTLNVFIDQSGNVIPFNTPPFLSPEWGTVFPFAMQEDDLTIHNRDGNDYWVYHDPGMPPEIDINDPSGMSAEYKWGFSLVTKWSSHLDKDDPTMVDISPASIGNIQSYPTTIEGLRDFYDPINGGDPSIGREVNPKTGMPYEPQMVKRGDYGRILAEFWADGPDSETPPGHWFTILNEIKDHPEYDKRFNGVGEVMGELEYDVKSYLMLSGALHDCAISAWGIKGYYDYVRPVSAIRALAEFGQSTSNQLPNYHPGGVELEEGFVELVGPDDPLVGEDGEHEDKIKVYAWRGPDHIINASFDEAGVGWILAENWWPYQRPSFVTPNFAGYISGHSTFSRAAAEVLTNLTGDEYFPGGMGVFEAPMNDFLVFEQGPSEDIELQWATYRDASDQCSLSRIWGGIHPPADDIPGRLIGIEIGTDAYEFAKDVFYNDADGDGFYSYEDCDDTDPNINPNSSEICDKVDNNCDGEVDEDLPLFTYYEDNDEDGYGNINAPIELCDDAPPMGYVTDSTDCNDDEALSNPGMTEVCDGIDNDCNELTDDGLETFRYYFDGDSDSFGDIDQPLDTCLASAPMDFVTNDFDCNDSDSNINPDIMEICDGVDNDCTGFADDGLETFRYYFDGDSDLFGDITQPLDTCLASAPADYVTNDFDCNDNDSNINPDAMEVCDAIDNDCTGIADDGLPTNRYYLDADEDGFGDKMIISDTCILVPPTGYVINDLDCNDNDPMINPDASEICDAIDNDCNGQADDGLPKNRYYLDADADGFGNILITADTCILVPPMGYVANNLDCNDNDSEINPDASEICDAIDNDCNGMADEGLDKNRYYLDNDQDGFGDNAFPADTCIDLPPIGYVVDNTDCNDQAANIYPNASEISDNDIDEDCNGVDYFKLTKIFPVPVMQEATIHFEIDGMVRVIVNAASGKTVMDDQLEFFDNRAALDLEDLSAGVYIIRLIDSNGEMIFIDRCYKS